jgi:hypothetical protein
MLFPNHNKPIRSGIMSSADHIRPSTSRCSLTKSDQSEAVSCCLATTSNTRSKRSNTIISHYANKHKCFYITDDFLWTMRRRYNSTNNILPTVNDSFTIKICTIRTNKIHLLCQNILDRFPAWQQYAPWDKIGLNPFSVSDYPG